MNRPGRAMPSGIGAQRSNHDYLRQRGVSAPTREASGGAEEGEYSSEEVAVRGNPNGVMQTDM